MMIYFYLVQCNIRDFETQRGFPPPPLASSSLIYTPLLSPSTQCLSIGELIINLIQKYSMVENTEMIQEHLEIIKKFNFINILNDLNGVISNPLFKTEETFETLLKSAEFAYKSKNYFQAIFYWQ
ncbi:TPA: hypothetical protein ACFOPB_001654, partial [Neisseria meningitidis]